MLRPLRGLTVIGAALVLAAGLSACAPEQKPEFVPPIKWDADSSHGQGEIFADHVVVELFEDGAARLTEFPRGRSVQNDEGYFCVEGPTDERYTGDATWEVRNRFSVFVSFGDSKVLVSSGSRFGEQDWTTIRFDSCIDERRWDFSYVCGDSGYGPDDGDLIFREECPVSD